MPQVSISRKIVFQNENKSKRNKDIIITVGVLNEISNHMTALNGNEAQIWLWILNGGGYDQDTFV